MKLKITGKYHVTATERKHIRLIFETTGDKPDAAPYKVGRKLYTFIPADQPGVFTYTCQYVEDGIRRTSRGVVRVAQ